MRESNANTMNRIAAVIAVGCFALVAGATDYYWIGGASGDWDKYYNWSLTPGGSAASTYPSNYAVDQATIDSAAAITLPGSNANVSNLIINANVELKDGSGKIHAKTISGSGKLTMRAGTCFYATEYCTTVSVDVEIPAGERVNVSNAGKNKNHGYGVMFTADCTLTGSGTIVFDSYRSSNPLYWDASGFIGQICVIEDSQTRNNTAIKTNIATHAGMTWAVTNSGANCFITQAGTYRFGSLSGRVYLPITSGYGYVNDIVMEIGGLNANDVLGGQFSRSGNRTDDGASIRKVGSGELSMSASGVNTYYVNDGVLNIAADSALSAKDDNGTPGTKVVFEGGVLRLADGVTKDASAYIALGESSSPVVFDDEGRDHVWNTALGASLTGGLTKKGSGTLTLAVAPAYTGTTTIEDGTLVVPQGTAIEKLSCAGGKITAPLTGATQETTIMTIAELADGTTVSNLEEAVAVAGATTRVAEAAGGGYDIKATYKHPYMWTGAVDNDWAKPGNWTIDGVVAETAPSAANGVNFPTSAVPWTVQLSNDVTVAFVRFEGDTALSGALIVCSDVAAASNGVKVALGDNAGFQENVAKLTLADMSFDIVADAAAPARFYFNIGSGFEIASTCKITGTGAVTFGVERDSTGIEIKADMTEFVGKATITNARLSANRSNTSIAQQSSSSNAVWQVNNGSKDKAFFTNGGVTYYFGSLSGTVSHNYAQVNSETAGFGYRMEIGHLGLNDELGGRFFSSTYSSRLKQALYQPILRKVGSGMLTFTGVEVAKYEINGGTFYCTADTAFATLTSDNDYWYTPITFSGEGGTLKLGEAVTLDLSTNFVNSTRAISIDDGGTNRTWTGVIAASNIGGFTKKGAGTLTLTAAPLYTGLTTVAAGVLAVPSGTVLDVCFAGGAITGANCRNVSFADGNSFRTGADAAIVASGTADVSNLVIYIADPAATAAYPVLAAAGGVSGTPTLAFPPETSDKLKERWLLRVGGKSVSVGTRLGGIFVLR